MVSRAFRPEFQASGKSFCRILQSKVIIHPQDAFFVQNPLGNHYGTTAKTFPGVGCMLYFNIVDWRLIPDNMRSRHLATRNDSMANFSVSVDF